MTETDSVSYDPAAAAAYTAAAAQVADLLGTAAAHADTAAGADLSGALGLLGADFLTAWTSAATSQAETLRIAAALMAGYSAQVTAHGNALTGIDADTAAALGATGTDIEGVRA